MKFLGDDGSISNDLTTGFTPTQQDAVQQWDATNFPASSSSSSSTFATPVTTTNDFILDTNNQLLAQLESQYGTATLDTSSGTTTPTTPTPDITNTGNIENLPNSTLSYDVAYMKFYQTDCFPAPDQPDMNVLNAMYPNDPAMVQSEAARIQQINNQNGTQNQTVPVNQTNQTNSSDILTDPFGNIVLDSTGNPVLDSARNPVLISQAIPQTTGGGQASSGLSDQEFLSTYKGGAISASGSGNGSSETGGAINVTQNSGNSGAINVTPNSGNSSSTWTARDSLELFKAILPAAAATAGATAVALMATPLSSLQTLFPVYSVATQASDVAGLLGFQLSQDQASRLNQGVLQTALQAQNSQASQSQSTSSINKYLVIGGGIVVILLFSFFGKKKAEMPET